MGASAVIRCRPVASPKCPDLQDFTSVGGRLRYRHGGRESARKLLAEGIDPAAAKRERRSAQWSDFDLAGAEWRIPAERMKMREVHVEFARAIARRHRCAVEVSVHRPGRGGDNRNHHAHLLCTTRRLTSGSFQDKTRELDDLKTGEVVFWRERWASLTNERLKTRGHDARIDHQTLAAQGIQREPTVHKGPLLTAIERRGFEVQVVRRRQFEYTQELQARLQRAAQFARLEQESRHLQGIFVSLSTNIAAARGQRDQVRDQVHEPARGGPETGKPDDER